MGEWERVFLNPGRLGILLLLTLLSGALFLGIHFFIRNSFGEGDSVVYF